MKRIIKFLFVAALAMVNVQVAMSQVDLVTKVAVGLGSISLTGGLAIGAEFHSLNSLNLITDVKVWKSYIIEKLRKDNSFLFDSVDAEKFILGGAVVYIPQAGADPVVEKNATTYPGVAVQRADSDINYALDTYRTVPSHIAWDELQTISYPKIDSVVGSHTDVLTEVIADNMLISWAPTTAGNIIATTGANIAGVDGQTGTRKALTGADVAKARTYLNKQGVPKGGRKGLLDDSMEEAFYNSLTDTQMNAFQQFADNKKGIIGRLHGFDFYTRSGVLAYANASNTPKAWGSALAATDNLASLFWHPNFVERAIGDIKPFQKKDDPLYYGDIWSMIVRSGGRKLREDNKGVVAIVQAAGA